MPARQIQNEGANDIDKKIQKLKSLMSSIKANLENLNLVEGAGFFLLGNINPLTGSVSIQIDLPLINRGYSTNSLRMILGAFQEMEIQPTYVGISCFLEIE